MRPKIPPSERIRQLLEGYLQGGYQQSEQPASEFLKLAAQMVAQEGLEQEVTDFLGRERFERQAEKNGYRNGYILQPLTGHSIYTPYLTLSL